MISSFMRLLGITVASLILLFLAGFFLRSMGLRQEFQAPPHAWMEWPKWSIGDVPLEKLCAPPEKLVPPGPVAIDGGEWIVQLPVRFDRATLKWVVPCPQKPQLAKFLEEHPAIRNWLLKVEASETTDLDALVTDADLNKGRLFGVWTQSQKVASYLRKHAPQWLFAAPPTALVRWQLYANLGLEPVMEFTPDFVILPNPGKESASLSLGGATELIRRKKRLIEGASSTIERNFPTHGSVSAW